MTLIELENEEYPGYFAIHPNGLHYHVSDGYIVGEPHVKNTATVSKDLSLWDHGWCRACLGGTDDVIVVDIERSNVKLENIPFRVH